MIRLLAFVPEDGWAYVQADGRISLIRPPYTSTQRSAADLDTIEKAVGQHGFQAMDQEFSGWAELIQFLNDQVRQARASTGPVSTEETLRAEMLRLAPTGILSGYLDRVESQWLPTGQLDAAESLLQAMLAVARVQQGQALLLRTSKLLALVSKTRNTRASGRAELTDRRPQLVRIFPDLTRRLGEDELAHYLDKVEQQETLMLVG